MRWRLLLHGPGNGAWNMAVDEALFHSAVAGTAPPTVRLYGWSRPTLSIGFRQDIHESCDLDACRKLGVDVVRRFTGGRAVLHDREITYCVAASAGDLGGLSVRQVYRWVSDVLRRAFETERLPIDPPSRATETTGNGGVENTLPCFAVRTRHEITSGGRKLVGAAQRWSRRGFSQHGSVLMEVDAVLDAKVWGSDTVRTAPESVGVQELSGGQLTVSRLTRILASEFERAFGEPASEHELQDREETTAAALVTQKYASTEWMFRRYPAATLTS